MQVTIVGAGALGRVYGTRLAASRGTPRVSFVVRPSRLADQGPIAVEQVNGPKRRDETTPHRVTTVPADSDAVLVTVRFDQLDASLVALLRDAPARTPIVVLTPLLPEQHAALSEGARRPVVAGMPGVSGYVDERDVVRYWVVAVAATLLDDPGPTGHDAHDPAGARGTLETLARELTRAGLPTRLERDVAAHNAATTTALFPLVAAVDAAGGVDGVLADKQLLSTVFDAAKESDALARKIGKVASWTTALTTFVGPFTLKPGVALARRMFPESVRFVEAHFGRKLHAQHVAMGQAILDAAARRSVEMPALARLVALLGSRRG